ncbi:MAG: histidinol dehydrogenase [Gaiellales bacterium]
MERLSLTRDSVGSAVAMLRPSPEARDDVQRTVADIVDMVRAGGDDAVRRLTLRLDGADLPTSRVAAAALARALATLDASVREALELMVENLRTVASELVPAQTRVTLAQGQTVSTRHVPVQRAGVYVPGGLAAYASTAAMAVVPAQVAGVPEICVCSAPDPDGLPRPAVLATCALLGVREVYAIGGAQAVAAMALGTEQIRPVDVLVGPGNPYVEEAKRRLFGEVGIESLAGPSELIVLADDAAPADILASDLIAQVEHGPGAQSVLVTTDADLLEAVAGLVSGYDQIALAEADSWDTAVAFVNAYAPEHLQLMVADPEAALEQIVHAGAIFLGEWSGTAFGDYVAGSNHILPTGGHVRFSQGLSPAVFLRAQEVIEVPAPAVDALVGPLQALAEAEGLPNHAQSARVRAERLRDATTQKGQRS